MTGAGAVRISVGVKGAIWRLNTKKNGRAEWEKKHTGSARVYAGRQPSHEKFSDRVAYDNLCTDRNVKKIPLFPQHMFS